MGIRVDIVKPAFVATDVAQNDTIYKLFLPESSNPCRDEFMAR
jgi:hypothetical protein